MFLNPLMLAACMAIITCIGKMTLDLTCVWIMLLDKTIFSYPTLNVHSPNNECFKKKANVQEMKCLSKICDKHILNLSPIRLTTFKSSFHANE